ncbi:MAG: efflux RND transporter periplasmic adaptor subunit [Elusimicrobiota bacterium]
MALRWLISKRHHWKTAAILLLVAGAVGPGIEHLKKRKQQKDAEPPAEETLAAVTRGDLEVRFREIGDVAAKNSVDIASKVSGRIIKLFVHEGQIVRAGQEIAVVQPGKTGAERYLPSTVTTPIGGLLLRHIKTGEAGRPDARFAEVGDYVTGLFESQNPTYLMTVADMRVVIVRLKISEMDIMKLREKMRVEVKIDALPDTRFPADVTMISPQAERESVGGKVFRVEVTLNHGDKRLRTGMTARVDALLEKREDVLKMPLSGLFEEKGKTIVYLDVPGAKPRQAIVETGLRTELDVEITRGIKEGDKVHTEKPVESTALPPAAFEEAAAK